MRALSFVVSVLLAGSAYAQAPASVYTPAQRDPGVPTFINATVVRVDARHNTVTFRSESREVTLTAEGDAIAPLGRLRPGDQVILGYRIDEASGRPVQIVTAILAAEEMARRGLATTNSPVASTAAGGSFSTVTGRIVGVDRDAGTFTLIDSAGRTETMAAQASALSSLGSVLPGDQVDVAFIPGSPGMLGGVVGVGGVFGTANTLQLASAPTFVTGAVQGFNPATGALTLRTAFGEQIFNLPPSANATSLGTLRVGQNVRLNLAGPAGRSFTAFTPLGVTAARTTTLASGTRTTAATGGVRTATLGTFATPLTPAARMSGQVAATTGSRTGTVTMAGTVNGAAPTRFTNTSLPRATATPTTRTTGTTRATTVGTVNGGFTTLGATTATTAGTTLAGGAGTVPITTATLAGVQPQRASGVLTTGTMTIPTSPTSLPTGGALASGSPNATGLPGGINTNTAAGAVNNGTVSFPGTTDLGSTGTITLGASPFASVIPSLPSVVGQLNVVPPPATAPTVPEALPVGAARDLATRDYDAGVRMMALKANEIDAHWFRYRDSCLRDNAVTSEIDRQLYSANRDRQWFVLFNEDVRTPADDNCRQLRIELNRMAEDWRDTMTRLEETARKNDVLPGAMRESRQRYRVEF